MKLILLLFYLVCCFSVTAQTYDEEVIMKACACIYHSEGENVDSIINNCMLKALYHSLAEDGITEKKIEGYAKQLPDTSSMFAEYLEALYKNCTSTKYLVEKKGKKYLHLSASGEANRYYTQGIELEKQSEPEEAIRSFEQALSVDSLFLRALDQAGTVSLQLQDIEKVIEYETRSLRIFPEGRDALANLSKAYFMTGEHQEALKYDSKLIKYHPDDPEGYLGLGRISLANNDYEGTVHLVKRADILAKDEDVHLECRKYLRETYYHMKVSGQEDLFREIAPEYAPVLYQPKEFVNLKNLPLDDLIDCRLAEPQILVCADYILSTPVDEKNENRVVAIAVVLQWAAKTPDYRYHIKQNVSKILDVKGEVMGVFMTALVKFSIENAGKPTSVNEQELYAWNTVLDYAAQKENRVPLTGDMKKMIKQKKKGKLKEALGLED